jgi:hypothetical protein
MGLVGATAVRAGEKLVTVTLAETSEIHSGSGCGRLAPAEQD